MERRLLLHIYINRKIIFLNIFRSVPIKYIIL